MTTTLRRASLIPLLCLLFSGQALAAEDPHEADRQQLRSMLADIETGINQRKMDLILPHLDEQVVVTYQNAEVARGIDAVKAFNARMMEGPSHVVRNITTKASVGGPAIFHGDTAVAYGTTLDEMELVSGMKFHLNAAWSATAIKKDGRWKAVDIHFSTNLLDNEVLNQTKRMVWFASVGAGLAGLLVGFIFGRRRKGG